MTPTRAEVAHWRHGMCAVLFPPCTVWVHCNKMNRLIGRCVRPLTGSLTNAHTHGSSIHGIIHQRTYPRSEGNIRNYRTRFVKKSLQILTRNLWVDCQIDMRACLSSGILAPLFWFSSRRRANFEGSRCEIQEIFVQWYLWGSSRPNVHSDKICA